MNIKKFSIFSAFSGFSTNTKYDPYQIKAEIASRRDRVSDAFPSPLPLCVDTHLYGKHICLTLLVV